ncbi:MAG: CHC2 zinc finger domain-containing protein [Promethearchaeia archaeon]
MKTQEQFKQIVEMCQKQLHLPQFSYIKKYLNKRYITNEMIAFYQLGFGQFYGKRWITIPIKDINDDIILFRLRKDPTDINNKIKYITFPKGIPSTIFGMKEILNNDTFAIAEGEMDKMILTSQGIPTITSTAGSQSFKKDWLFIFKNCKKVFICLDRDDAGEKGAERLGNMILNKYPNIQVYNCVLPEAVGEHGDITDLMILSKGQIDVDKLLYENSHLMKLEKKEEKKQKEIKINNYNGGAISQADIEKASKVNCKKFIKIERESNGIAWAKCPFVEENTASFACYSGGKGCYCFSCGFGSDAIELVKKLYNLSFQEAVKYVLNNS